MPTDRQMAFPRVSDIASGGAFDCVTAVVDVCQQVRWALPRLSPILLSSAFVHARCVAEVGGRTRARSQQVSASRLVRSVSLGSSFCSPSGRLSARLGPVSTLLLSDCEERDCKGGGRPRSRTSIILTMSCCLSRSSYMSVRVPSHPPPPSLHSRAQHTAWVRSTWRFRGSFLHSSDGCSAAAGPFSGAPATTPATATTAGGGGMMRG